MLDTYGFAYIGTFLVLALLCVGIGIFFLLRMGKPDTLHNTNKQNSKEDSPQVAATVVEKILAKKGLLIDDWRRTNRLRDQMKILKISTNAKKAAQKNP